MLTLDVLNYVPDGTGECDRCHKDDQALWEDYDEPGGWQYCRTCIRDMHNKRKERDRNGSSVLPLRQADQG